MNNRPLKPRDWKTTQAIDAAKKATFALPSMARGKQYPVFNGSQNNPNNKKRPITLPGTERKP